ncbi:hypothetical protein [Uliginosibacterium sp. H1]|uniref:hypothetical protein n=1 Tax=Uliginosibacterium sp. H1 TaxID=3114757 RepID=UPI00280A0B72|nr:hypothetical protein [Moraxellaceae bacterium]MEC5399632.1 hypothetical protein [Uliginosibacterium sp. H1]
MQHVRPPECQDCSTDQALANLLCMLHLYFVGEHCANCEERLSDAICAHFQELGERGELGNVSRETCLELADHWAMRMRKAHATATTH